MESAELHVGMTFNTFLKAKHAISDFCARHYHPIRCDKKETVGSYNSHCHCAVRHDCYPYDLGYRK